MKKVLALLIAMTLLVLTACGGGNDQTADTTDASDTQQEQQTGDPAEESETVPDEFVVAAGDDLAYEGLIFEDDITIHLDPESTVEQRSQILFAGCTFYGDITVVGDKSAFLRFVEGCVFSETCEITVVEATDGAADGMTLEDDFVKLLFTDTGAVVNAESVCNVVCYNGEGIVVDGVEYLQTDFPDHAAFCVATYFENGEKQVFTLGLDD